MSQVMCRCGSCGVKPGIRTGLSGLGHFGNWCLILLTGALWLIPYLLIWACSYSTRCITCGRQSKKL